MEDYIIDRQQEQTSENDIPNIDSQTDPQNLSENHQSAEYKADDNIGEQDADPESNTISADEQTSDDDETFNAESTDPTVPQDDITDPSADTSDVDGEGTSETDPEEETENTSEEDTVIVQETSSTESASAQQNDLDNISILEDIVIAAETLSQNDSSKQEYIVNLKNASVYHADSARNEKSARKYGELVLSDVNLQVGASEMIYFIGRVGSGKSSLLRTLYAEIPLYVGEGYVAGHNLKQLKRRNIPHLRRKLGVVFQDYQLLTDRNVYQNLYYIMSATGWRDRTAMRRRIEEVLQLVGLSHKEYKMPFQLSGGEQQRLSIARAVINRPKLLLADEPTGNLDPAAADDIMELFREIVKSGCSIIMTTHNIGNIQRYPSRTFRFNQGKVEPINIHSILGISE